MSTSLAPVNGHHLPDKPDISRVNDIEAFVGILNINPPADDIKINSAAGNSNYLPISFVENKLDELFFGLWQTRNFRWQVVANEIIATIELGAFHPVARVWLWREGSGAVLIQQKRDSDITDIGAKIKNTLVKDFPHLKSECIKNAAKSLGKAFGRDLNRQFFDTYEPAAEKMEAIISDDFRAAMDSCKTMSDLTELWKQNPQYHSNDFALDTFTKAKARINGKQRR